MKMYSLGWNVLMVIYIRSTVGCVSFFGKSGHDELSLADCLPERNNQDTLSGQSGSIIKVADQFVLLSKDENSRYLACNLPETYKNEGLEVTYSLITKEIQPNERLIATPAYLTEIKP